MSRGCFALVLLAGAGMTPEEGRAQTSPPNGPEAVPVETLPPLTITSVRSARHPSEIPVSVSKLQRWEIQSAQPALTLDESLARLPGVFFQNPFNFAQDLRIAIRGFGARSPFGVRGLKVLVDGFPQTMPDGLTQLDSIDLGVVDSIEMTRGPSASLYGNASGGVLSIHTEDGPEAPWEVESRGTAGEFGFEKYQLKFGGTLNSVNYRFHTSHLRVDGYRDHSATENTLVQGKVHFRPDAGSQWTLTAGIFNSPLAEDPGGLTQAQTEARPEQASAANLLFSAGEKVEEENVGLRFQKSISETLDLTLMTHLTRREFSNRLPFTPGGRVEFERLAPGGGVKFILNIPLLERANRLIGGVDVFYQHDDRKRFNNLQGRKGAKTLDQIENVLSVGPYLRDELTLSDRLDIVGGLRYDRVRFELEDAFLSDGDQSDSITFTEWSGTAGAVLHLSESRHLYAGFATVFEVPTTTELINNPSGAPGFNPGLEPQTSRSYEIGLKGEEPGGVDYDLALFFIQSDDELIPFELPATPGRTFFANAGGSERRGLEGRLGYRPHSTTRFSLSYTYSDFEFTAPGPSGPSFAGKALPGIPKHRVVGNVFARHPDGWFARLEFQYVGEFFADNLNDHRNRAYTTSHLRMGKEGIAGAVRWTAFLGLNNLLDEAYNANVRLNAAKGRFFEPAPPFNIFGGITLAYHPPDSL